MLTCYNHSVISSKLSQYFCFIFRCMSELLFLLLLLLLYSLHFMFCKWQSFDLTQYLLNSVCIRQAKILNSATYR